MGRTAIAINHSTLKLTATAQVVLVKWFVVKCRGLNHHWTFWPYKLLNGHTYFWLPLTRKGCRSYLKSWIPWIIHCPSRKTKKSSLLWAARHSSLCFFFLSCCLPSDRLILKTTRLLDVWQLINKQMTTCDLDTDQELIATDWLLWRDQIIRNTIDHLNSLYQQHFVPQTFIK